MKKVNKDDQVGTKQLIELKTEDPIVAAATVDKVEFLHSEQ